MIGFMNFQKSFIKAAILKIAVFLYNQVRYIHINNKGLRSYQVDYFMDGVGLNNLTIGGPPVVTSVKFITKELFKYFRVKISRSVVLMFLDGNYSYNSYKARIAGR